MNIHDVTLEDEDIARLHFFNHDIKDIAVTKNVTVDHVAQVLYKLGYINRLNSDLRMLTWEYKCLGSLAGTTISSTTFHIGKQLKIQFEKEQKEDARIFAIVKPLQEEISTLKSDMAMMHDKLALILTVFNIK